MPDERAEERLELLHMLLDNAERPGPKPETFTICVKMGFADAVKVLKAGLESPQAMHDTLAGKLKAGKCQFEELYPQRE